MIEVTGLVKKYGNHVAVDHLSFRLEPGKIYGFLGPNGAGKSTTMNMMTGYIGPTEGTILINGHDIVKEPAEAKRCIGYLPELPPLYTDMTVWEYLEFAAQLKNIPAKKRQESILNAMKMTGLVDVAKRLIKNLSKGYRQRVGFAQAVLGMPEIIILDEPTVGLDPIQIIEIRSLIKELAKEHTVILSSHILSEISAVCDEILIISHGRLVASDTTENLMHYMDSDAMLEISIRAPKEQAKNSFAQLHHVAAVLEATKQNEDDKHLNLTSFEIRTDGADVREAVFGICAEKNWPIYEMKYSKATLEDVFMELTADNKAHEEEMDEIKKSAEEAVKEAEQTKFNREFKSYFTSMIGPVFVAALVLVTGIYFMVYNMSYGYPYFAYTLSASAIVFVLTVPLLTMRSFSEERHSKTDQLLLTSPVSVTQIVLGKFFSMTAVVAIPCVIFCLCPLIIKSTGTAYFLVDYSTILVYFLIGCAYVAIGMLISAMTESVIIAAVGTIITLLLINLSNGLSQYVPNTAIASLIGCLILLVLLCVIVYVMTKSNAATFGLLIGGAAVLIILYVVKPALFEGLVPGMIENIAFAKVMTSFVSDYVFDVKGVVELISICAACIFLTTQVIQKRRWS